MKNDGRNRFDWCAVVGGLLVAALLTSLFIISVTSWIEFKTFLRDSASGWIQAFGSIATIICGFVYIDRANRSQEERELFTTHDLHQRQFLAVREACHQFDEVVAWAQVGTAEGINDNAALEMAVREALDAFKSISLSEVPDAELLEHCGLLRKDLVTLLIHCHAANTKEGLKSHEYLSDFMPRLEEDLKKTKNRVNTLLNEGLLWFIENQTS